MSRGNVYFLQVGTDGPIKIGFTTHDIKRRVRALQGGSPHILRWIGFYPGTRDDETNAHRLLRNSRHRAEWFYPTQEVLAFVLQQSPDFVPLVVENATFKPPHNGRGSGRHKISIARPA